MSVKESIRLTDALTEYTSPQANGTPFIMLVCTDHSSRSPLGWRLTSRERKGKKTGGGMKEQTCNHEVIYCMCAVGILQSLKVSLKKQIGSHTRLVFV